MTSSSVIGGDAQTRQSPLTTLHRDLRVAPRSLHTSTTPKADRGPRWSRLVFRSFRPLALAVVASLSGPDTSDAQTNCDACWTTVTNWQGTYSLTVTGSGPYENGTFQVNDSSQGSFVLTNAFGSTTVFAGTLVGTGSIDVSGISPCISGGQETCSTSGSGALVGASSVSLLIDTTNCTYQITIVDGIAGTSVLTACDGTIVNQFSVVQPASGDLAGPSSFGAVGTLPSFPLPDFGESLTESGGTFTGTTIGVGSCEPIGSFTLTISWNIQPEISTAVPQFTQVPTGGPLGCNPTNLPNASSVLDNTSATAASGMVSIEAESIDVTNGCGVTRTFTLTATDDCSQEQAQAVVAYSWTNDTNAPVFTQLPPGGNLGTNPPSVPDDAAAKSMTRATDDCSTPSITVTHMDSGTSVFMRTFTITATDGCSNKTIATVAYTWTGTIGVGTNSSPLLETVRSGTNIVLFWPTNAVAFAAQFNTNLTASNAWMNLTNNPVVTGGTNFITNPISRSTLFYRLIH